MQLLVEIISLKSFYVYNNFVQRIIYFYIFERNCVIQLVQFESEDFPIWTLAAVTVVAIWYHVNVCII